MQVLEDDRKVCIIGLGYVGLPLACLASQKYQVVGVDINEERVTLVNQGICPTTEKSTQELFAISRPYATTDASVARDADLVLVCVPTPVTKEKIPNLNPLKSAISSVAKHLKEGQLIIVESTIHPGTTEEVLIPILEEQSGLKCGTDFSVVYCPERIDPGNMRWNLKNIARVLGASTAREGERARKFYTTFIDAEVTLLNSIKAAEATKILENSFRDVNIAFINEMAISFDKFGIDITEVIKGAATKPFGYMPFYPGPGVGGHCIPVDPYYLIERSKKNDFDHQFLNIARKINDSMPNYVVEVLQNEMNKLGVPIKGSRIGLYGLSYKRNIEDLRNSPSAKIRDLLLKLEGNLCVFDPYAIDKSTYPSLQSFLMNIDYLVVCTNHDEILQLSPAEFSHLKLVLDTRNCLSEDVRRSVMYRGIGR